MAWSAKTVSGRTVAISMKPPPPPRSAGCRACRGWARSPPEVREGGLAPGAPVHEPRGPVGEALVVVAAEGVAHRAGALLVHGEGLPAPVGARPEALELLEDRPPGLLLPLPDPFQELLPPQVVPGLPLLEEEALHHHLGGDPGVVGAGKPHRLKPPHALVADEGVLEAVVQGMAHVEGAGDVRGRHEDDEGGLPLLGFATKGFFAHFSAHLGSTDLGS